VSISHPSRWRRCRYLGDNVTDAGSKWKIGCVAATLSIVALAAVSDVALDVLAFVMLLFLAVPGSALYLLGVRAPLVDQAHGPAYLTIFGVVVVYGFVGALAFVSWRYWRRRETKLPQRD